MRIQYKHQKFQADAAKAVVDVFAGQPYLTPSYMMDRGTGTFQIGINEEEDYTGWSNHRIIPELNDQLILEHLQKIQRANQIAPSSKLEGRADGYNLTVEMETGVGKTYTYIKTMYELNRAYGWSKFIIVVPSIAIREGVYKSFEMTQEHFAEEYGKKIRFFIYIKIRFDGAFSFALLREITCSAASYSIGVFSTALRKGQNMYFNQVEFGKRLQECRRSKVSLRDGRYVVFDGQHVIAARVDKNSGEELPILCKVYSGLSDQEEASLFANQTGFGVAPSIGMKLRALVFAGDPEAVNFLKATEEIGLRIDYGQHKGRRRVACIAAALTEFRKLGPAKYQEAMKMILEGWDGDPDSLRAETVTGVCRFVDLYNGEYDPKRVVKRFRTVDPLKIYRDGKAMGDNLPGYKKYLYQVLLIYNGASKKAALPMKF